MEKIEFSSDPKYLGPGVWFSIHLLAKNATTPSLKMLFKNYLYKLQEDFPCPMCRSHIVEFLKENSLTPYFDLKDSQGRDIGCFKFSWMFHNTVNQRLQKPHFSWNSAIDIYYNKNLPTGVCNSGCLETH